MAGGLFGVCICNGAASCLGRKTVDFIRAQDSPLLEDLTLLIIECVADSDSFSTKTFSLAGSELLNVLADTDTAPVMATHGTEISVYVEVLIVVSAGHIRVKGQIELALPVECGTGLGELIVSVARSWDTESDVSGMGCDLVGDAALFDVFLFGET